MGGMVHARFAAGVALAILIFAVDLPIPGGYAVGVLYLLPLVLLLALRSEVVWHGPALALLATGLTLLDILVGATGPDLQQTLVNRSLTVMALWVTAALVELGRRRARALAESQQRAAALFEAALDAAPDAMLVVDGGGKVRAVNGGATRVFGYAREELLGRPYGSLVSERRGALSPMGAAAALGSPMGIPLQTRSATQGPLVGIKKGGAEVALETSCSSFESNGEVLWIHANRDVTDRRKLEERLVSSQRMEAIGRLAGGIAHDFNNLLAVIMSYAQLAGDSLPRGDTTKDDLEEVVSAADRAAGLTRQLLAFSRRQVVKPLRFQPGGLVHDMEKMLRRLIGENIELLTVGFDSEGLVEVDPSQLEQVILNLVINARDAMPQGGRITVEMANVTLDQAYCNTHPDVTPGEYVMLAVTDTGMGMTEDVRLRVFEPFFTTKGPGAGTGLGLSTVYGIVKQAEGHIWVYSEPGHGSTFKAYFPKKGGAPDALPSLRPSAAAGGHESILFVEDEAPLRRVAVRILKKAGYEVLEAGNGLDALRKVETGVRIDLLITDVIMPMMGGHELATKLLERDPALTVLYISGYTENAIVHRGVLEPDTIFLQKPFQPDELLRRVRQVLDTRPAAPRTP